MKAVFAITSQGNDFYTAMTRVAVASLRLSNPTMRLVVACDAESDLAMRRSRDPLIEEVDEWLVVETPPGNAGFRNRFVKTSLRATVSGPFLFLDSDIFVRGDLSEIFQLDTDIAGARNHSREAFAEQVWEQDRATLDAMGWEIGNEVYINGGVLFYNDTDGARRFGAEWHRRWIQSSRERGNYRDQPALNSSLHAVGPRLWVLDNKFNAQVKTNADTAIKACVWHFYSDSSVPSFFQFDFIVSELAVSGYLDMAQVKKLARKREPWRDGIFFDKYVYKRLVNKGFSTGWEYKWFSESRSRAIAHLIKRIQVNLYGAQKNK